jgi:hypothetical protein
MTRLGWLPLAALSVATAGSVALGLVQADRTPPWEVERGDLPLVSTNPPAFDASACPGAELVWMTIDSVAPAVAAPDVQAVNEAVSDFGMQKDRAERLDFDWVYHYRDYATYVAIEPSHRQPVFRMHFVLLEGAWTAIMVERCAAA